VSTIHDILQERGPLPVDEACNWLIQSCRGLQAAHDRNIIHRDIKPGNLMLTKAGVLKVADFGVAKAVGEKTDLTRTGMMVGSPAYMSPEQVKGMSLDGRSDLFSLGVVLYELVLRRKPFPADTLTTLIFQILNDDPLAKPEQLAPLGDETAAFLRTCLTKDPKQRVPDAASFAAGARALIARVSRRQVDQTAPTTFLKASRTATGTAQAPPPPGATVAVPPPAGASRVAPPPPTATTSVPPPSPAATDRYRRGRSR
jgi:serine/threonine-protein kinase